MTVAAAPTDARPFVRRELTEAEQAIDILKLDRALTRAKDELDKAIHREIARAVLATVELNLPVFLNVTDRMLEPLNRLARIGRAEAWLELDRLGYQTQGRRRYIEERPTDPGDLLGYLARNLRQLLPWVEDELVHLDIGVLSQDAIARALLRVPGARDIASRVVSTALYAGMAETFEQNADLVECWQYTAILDSGTCAACFPLDGREYRSLLELFEHLPNFGPNPACLGGGRCRCRAVPCPASRGGRMGRRRQ